MYVSALLLIWEEQRLFTHAIFFVFRPKGEGNKYASASALTWKRGYNLNIQDKTRGIIF
jgi:hypothetical protein